jgi:hypothetical protein
VNAPRTKLGQKLAGGGGAPASEPSSTPLRGIVAAGKRGEEVVLPVLGRVWLELPGARQWQEIESEVRKEMRRLEVGDLHVGTAAQHETELALRVLAVAVRDPDRRDQRFGTLEEWGELDNDIVSVAWHAFGDVRERLDPVSQPLSNDEMLAVSAAVKKKDATLLRTFGVVRLSAWLATTGEPPSTSPIPSSSSTEDSSAP